MTPANTTGPGGTTLYYGDLNTPHVLQVFLELRDRASRTMSETLLQTFRQAADERKLVVKFHFAATIDDTVGGIGSQRGLSALAAAADVGQKEFVDYLSALFAAQPFPPVDDKFSETSELLSQAGKVEGLRSAEFDRKVTDNVYLNWAGETVGSFSSFGVIGTPVLWYDGEVIPVVNADGESLSLNPQEFLSELRK